MDSRAQLRLYVLNHVLAGELTAVGAATYLEVSVRVEDLKVDKLASVR